MIIAIVAVALASLSSLLWLRVAIAGALWALLVAVGPWLLAALMLFLTRQMQRNVRVYSAAVVLLAGAAFFAIPGLATLPPW